MIEARSISGTGKAVLEFAKEAIQNRQGAPQIELSILTFSRDNAENALTAAMRDLRLPLDIVFERGRFDFRIIPQLRSVVAKRSPDLIWSNSVKSHFLVRWAELNRSCRWVAFHHGHTWTDFKTCVYNQTDRWSLRAADQVLTSSRAFVKELEQRDVRPEKIHVQHMAVRPFGRISPERAGSIRRELGIDPCTRILLSVGRLSREKGHTDLIRSFARMRKLTGGQVVHLVIVGEGPERNRMESLIRSLDLTKAVTLAGQQDDVAPYYAIADVFVLPSHNEGSPNVLLEAIDAGVPVVATKVGGIPEIVSEREALLVPKGDTDALAEATARILVDGPLRERLVAAAREAISCKTPEAYFRSMTSVFERALA